jgi:hypothetical protein
MHRTKSLLSAFLIAIIVGGFAVAGILHFGTVQAATDVAGIINSDTTWTKANSPYSLTGHVGVGSGVTLTIEPGVTVNLGAYFLQVSGTLYARGSSLNNIIFISKTPSYGNIAFVDGSNSWNEQTGSGSIIENAILSSTSISITNVSPKINNNTISAAINIDGGSPAIMNNIITGDIGVHSSSPKIDNNSIIGGINIGGNSPIISNNIIKGGGVGNGVGIEFDGPYSIYISDNIIYGCPIGVRARGWAIIERNLIINNDEGMEVLSSAIQIRDNTIADNSVAIRIRYSAPTIIYNNIQNNIQNSIHLESNLGDVNATYNWWGTADAQLIELTIHDSKNEPNVGAVDFVPFLTAPNPEAPTTAFTPITTPTPTQSPSLSPSPSQSPTTTPATPQAGLYEIAIAIFIALIVIVALLIVILALVLKKRQ